MARIPYLAALAVFLVFFANVCLGAFGGRAFLGDVAEMLILFVAAVLFVAGALLSEMAAQTRKDS